MRDRKAHGFTAFVSRCMTLLTSVGVPCRNYRMKKNSRIWHHTVSCDMSWRGMAHVRTTRHTITMCAMRCHDTAGWDMICNVKGMKYYFMSVSNLTCADVQTLRITCPQCLNITRRTGPSRNSIFTRTPSVIRALPHWPQP